MKFLSSRLLIWLRRLGLALAAVLLLWVVTWAVLPPLLQSQAETRLTALLGRSVTIGAVEFKPWTLELALHDVAVATQDGHGVQFSVARVYVNGSMESLWRLAPVVDAVRVEAPYVQLRYAGQGHYDVDDILQRLAQPDGSTSAPVLFAVYNVTLSGGSVDFTDASQVGQQRQHTLRDLQFSIPFLSNFNSQREVLVEPHLAFVLNGSAFDSAAKGTPFAQTRQGEAQLNIQQLDLKPYLPYWPATLPLQLHGATLDAALKVAFEQQPQAALRISGDLVVHQLALADATGAALLSVDTVRATLHDVQPLVRQIHLSTLEITQPHVQLRREHNGRLNIDAAGAPGEKAAKSQAASAAATPGWTVGVDHLALHEGQVDWQDLQTPANLTLAALDFKAQDLHWPMEKDAQADLSATVAGTPTPARLVLHAKGTEQQGQLQLSVKDAPLGVANPYLAAWLEPRVRGVLDATAELNWRAGQLQANVSRMAVRDAGLESSAAAGAGKSAGRGPAAATDSGMPSFKLLELRDTALDLGKRTVRVGQLRLQQPSLDMQRAADGAWMYSHWLKPSPAASPTSANAAAGAAPWSVVLGELAVQDAKVQFTDRFNERPVHLSVSALSVQATGAQLDGKKPVPLRVSARVATGQADGGTLGFQGTVAWTPELAVQGNLQLQELPAHALAPYVASQVNVDVVRADASFAGKVRFSTAPSGPTLALQGDAVLEDFRANTVPGSAQSFAEELLSWKALNVPGVDVSMAPGTATRVAVREAALSDFYARIMVAPNGRLNLQDLLKTPAQAEQAATAPAQAPAAPAVRSSTGTAAEPAPVITMGPISLVNGAVFFSDRFIQPNYTANLSGLTGKLSAFSNQSSQGAVQMADLELRGRAEGTASLEITGKLNPLAKPLALDIAGKVRELELPPLSPYAIKYAGYGISRGKLSMDVHYAVQPDGQLSASNKLVLNQLSFGDKADGSPHSLPVKLAAALLADRNGVIDLDLPISGSLNDPQFRVGPILWKVIGNIISKAVTAPFSLLAHALGGGADTDLHAVAFDPGSASLTSSAQTGLDTLARALIDRPGLQLTVVGTAQLEHEREAMQREQLRALLLAEKRRQSSAQAQDAAAVTSYSDAEMPALLREVYRRADIPKPRNLLGMRKTLEVPEMEALLLANIGVTAESARDLALQRGVVVRDYLAAHGVGMDRLFLGAVNTEASGEEAKPQAELSLAN